MIQFYFDIAFLVIVTPLIILVGQTCFLNGNVFVDYLSFDDIELSRQINKFLLIGYYLVVIGLSVFTLSYWKDINSFKELIKLLYKSIGIMVFSLAILHYLNILTIYYFFKNYKNEKS